MFDRETLQLTFTLTTKCYPKDSKISNFTRTADEVYRTTSTYYFHIIELYRLTLLRYKLEKFESTQLYDSKSCLDRANTTIEIMEHPWLRSKQDDNSAVGS